VTTEEIGFVEVEEFVVVDEDFKLVDIHMSIRKIS
jgi:hypothetical protein